MSPRRKQEERSVLRLVVQSDSPRKRVLRCRRPKAETDARPPIESSQYLLRASRHREEVEAIPARGSGTGVGLGTGPGTTSASGSGAGSGSGKGSLPGLTIQGTNGAYGNGAAVVKSHVDGIKLPAQTAYGMTVVSLASSGGGLPDVGVFEDEKVYTVYVDMRATPEDPAPSYTLQYALLQPPTGVDSASLQAGLTPPYPVEETLRVRLIVEPIFSRACDCTGIKIVVWQVRLAGVYMD